MGTKSAPELDGGLDIIAMIADGRITRERACDGKKAYRTPEFAERQANDLGTRFNTPMVSYHCPFCNQYHLATRL